jgi:adenine-specific DNA-methyltransferase
LPFILGVSLGYVRLGQVTVSVTEKNAVAEKANSSDNKKKYAQFFTPETVAEFMAAMFQADSTRPVTILDPGAGEGILGLALNKRLTDSGITASSTFMEIDEQVFGRLKNRVDRQLANARTTLANDDFVKEGLRLLQDGKRFSHIIMNPPYFKMRRSSRESDFLVSCGINVTNIYAAFMWLGILLLEDGGQLVAIVPRSFCNGPYFLRFREFVAASASIEAIHTFGSRDKVFSKDSVLQENVIIRFAKKPQSEQVRISHSSDQGFTDVEEVPFAVSEVFPPDDPDLTIRIPQSGKTIQLEEIAPCSLPDLGLEVSTGPIVDFRAREAISSHGRTGSVPLLYPAHMKDGHVAWPMGNLSKKGQYYCPQKNLWGTGDSSPIGDKNVSPADGCYVIIRRFSSKEERRRVFAAVVDPAEYGAGGVVFENHLNYFHIKKHGFDKELAFGLSAYLNSFVLDEHFRSFSGHTQVNATDLRNIPYPSKKQLRAIGEIASRNGTPIEEIVTEDLLRSTA